jgi:hypothetical protein
LGGFEQDPLEEEEEEEEKTRRFRFVSRQVTGLLDNGLPTNSLLSFLL